MAHMSKIYHTGKEIDDFDGVQLCWGLNYSHLLECRAVVKAG